MKWSKLLHEARSRDDVLFRKSTITFGGRRGRHVSDGLFRLTSRGEASDGNVDDDNIPVDYDPPPSSRGAGTHLRDGVAVSRLQSLDVDVLLVAPDRQGRRRPMRSGLCPERQGGQRQMEMRQGEIRR